jgi:dihydroorotate dehydrogenase
MGYPLLRPLLFALEPEAAHGLATRALAGLQRLPALERAVARRCALASPRLVQDLFGCRFPGPVGLAAGFDKDGRLVRAFAALGAGSVEVGTVTPRPQPGNPKPRLFRYPAERSLQNSLGFNSSGKVVVERNLRFSADSGIPVGVNLGNNSDTPIEVAKRDFLELVEALGPWADYLVLNVSSPNTPGLRSLQTAEGLVPLLAGARQLTDRPVLVKLAPDLEPAAAVELARAAVEGGAAGVVATNTTVDRTLLPGARPEGGLSGRVLRERSFTQLQALAGALFGRCALVSVGGVDSAAEAYRRLRAGASLVQLYSGLVFEGPALFRRIHRGLLELLDRDGLGSIAEAVGADLRREAA